MTKLAKAEITLRHAAQYCDRRGDEAALELLSALGCAVDSEARGNHLNAQAWEEIALEIASGRPMYR